MQTDRCELGVGPRLAGGGYDGVAVERSVAVAEEQSGAKLERQMEDMAGYFELVWVDVAPEEGEEDIVGCWAFDTPKPRSPATG